LPGKVVRHPAILQHGKEIAVNKVIKATYVNSSRTSIEVPRGAVKFSTCEIRPAYRTDGLKTEKLCAMNMKFLTHLQKKLVSL
jgi:hypothetical protein